MSEFFRKRKSSRTIKMNQNGENYDNLDQSLDNSPANFSVLSKTEECYEGLINWCISKADYEKYQTTSITSQYFNIDNNNYKFYMTLFPNGIDESSRNSVSLIITFYCNLPKSAWVEGTASVSGKETTNFSMGGGIQQIFLNSLLETRGLSDFLVANDFVIQCSMKMKFKTVKCICDNNSVTYDLSKKCDSHGIKLFQNKTFSDVTFRLQDQDIKAHKVKLVRVPYFERLFKDEDESKCLFELSGIDFSIFEKVLEFIYTNDLPLLNSRLACQLYVVADDLEFTDLKVLCASYLGANLTPKNVVIVLLLAGKCNDYPLKKECFEFIGKSNSKILADDAIMFFN